MINLIVGKKIKQVEKISKDLEHFKRVVIDLGCGDGKQTYKLAATNPGTFFIGIDPNYKALEETSRKIKNKLAKGGLPNIEFIHATTESIPDELESIADEIQINFPWGKLLEGAVKADVSIMDGIIKLAKDSSDLIITTTYDDKFEPEFKVERALPPLSFDFLETELKQAYLNFGIKITEISELTESEKKGILSPWGKKLISTRERTVYKIKGKIFK